MDPCRTRRCGRAVAAVSRRVVVSPTTATALPGDEPILVDPGDLGPGSTAVAAGRSAFAEEPRMAAASAAPAVEVVVDGWRFELEVEDERRAVLRRRATRERDADASSGPTEIRAIIPGRVAAVRVAVGDEVEAGQGLLVVEAMKMQNELRAPRAGTIERVAVDEGRTIDHGDLLVVLR